MRCDVGVGGRGRVAELSLCIVHCNVYFCIITLHNSTAVLTRSVDMIVNIRLRLALSSKCLCIFSYL